MKNIIKYNDLKLLDIRLENRSYELVMHNTFDFYTSNKP